MEQTNPHVTSLGASPSCLQKMAHPPASPERGHEAKTHVTGLPSTILDRVHSVALGSIQRPLLFHVQRQPPLSVVDCLGERSLDFSVNVVVKAKAHGGSCCVVDHDGRAGGVAAVFDVHVRGTQCCSIEGRAYLRHCFCCACLLAACRFVCGFTLCKDIFSFLGRVRGVGYIMKWWVPGMALDIFQRKR